MQIKCSSVAKNEEILANFYKLDPLSAEANNDKHSSITNDECDFYFQNVDNLIGSRNNYATQSKNKFTRRLNINNENYKYFPRSENQFVSDTAGISLANVENFEHQNIETLYEFSESQNVLRQMQYYTEIKSAPELYETDNFCKKDIMLLNVPLVAHESVTCSDSENPLTTCSSSETNFEPLLQEMYYKTNLTSGDKIKNREKSDITYKLNQQRIDDGYHSYHEMSNKIMNNKIECTETEKDNKINNNHENSNTSSNENDNLSNTFPCFNTYVYGCIPFKPYYQNTKDSDSVKTFTSEQAISGTSFDSLEVDLTSYKSVFPWTTPTSLASDSRLEDDLTLSNEKCHHSLESPNSSKHKVSLNFRLQPWSNIDAEVSIYIFNGH